MDDQQQNAAPLKVRELVELLLRFDQDADVCRLLPTSYDVTEVYEVSVDAMPLDGKVVIILE